jgi:hypothetical protein
MNDCTNHSDYTATIPLIEAKEYIIVTIMPTFF